MRGQYLFAMAALAIASPAVAQTQLVTNGGFETGTLAGWSVTTQSGSDGGFFAVPNVGGGMAPQSGLPYEPGPGGGAFFAMSDQNGAGSYALTQAFTLATAASVTFAFDLFANDYAGTTGDGRDYTVSGTQNATVDVLAGGADPLTDRSGDIVSVLYAPGADDTGGNPNAFTRYSLVRSLSAGTYQLRFAETHSLGFLNMGIDNVSVSANAVPEPVTWTMMIAGFGVAGAALRRRKAAAGTVAA